jgi:hypothetical protein
LHPELQQHQKSFNFRFSSYSIDDGILFRLNFQPSESSTTTTTKTDESGSAIPADESLLGTKVEDSLFGTKSSDDFETVLISTGRNEQYHCSLPKSDTKAGQVKAKIEYFVHAKT